MKKLCEYEISELNAKVTCSCGESHDGVLNVVLSANVVGEVKKIKERGRVLVIASSEVDKGYVDDLHSELAEAEYVVRRFDRGEVYKDYESLDGVDVLIAVGDERIIERCKTLALTFNTSLVVIPIGFNYWDYLTASAVIDYDGVRVIRPARAPDVVIADSRVMTFCSKSRWADSIGDMYAKVIAFFDYAFKSETKGVGCRYIVDKALSILETGIGYFEKNPQSVEAIMEIALAVASLSKMTGGETGGEGQVADTLERFAKNHQRSGTARGEVRFLSALIVGRVYKKFLSVKCPYGVGDAFMDMNKSRRILGIDELEAVRLAKQNAYGVATSLEYGLEVARGELKMLADRCDKLLTDAHYKLMRIYPDKGYHLRYYMTSEEILGVVECAPFFSRRDTLLSFIKGRGLLTLTGA